MTERDETKFSRSVDDAIRRLISVERFHAGSLVSMPLLYPSGASVVLELSYQAGRLFVSDRGGGFQEADHSSSTKAFLREAYRIADDAGIRFDGKDFTVADVPLERADGAMAVVANCSAQAAAISVIRAAEREDKIAREALFDRLAEVFGPSGFEKDSKLVGASNHTWRVDAAVKSDTGIAVFNAVTRQYTSATGTAAKFFDLARLETAPYRIAVVASRTEMGDWYGVISAASNSVVELSAVNDQFRRLRNIA